MADNVMGPEVNLGLNVNLELDRSAQDAASLADQIRQMRMDQEAFRDVISDTQDRIREITGYYQEQLQLRQQLLDVETSLRNISESRTDSLKDQVSAYRDIEQSAARISNYGSSPISMPGGGQGYYGSGMNEYYNPLNGQMMGMGGMGSAFDSQVESDEEALESEQFEKDQDRGGRDGFERKAQKLFYYSQLPKETAESLKRVGSAFKKLNLPGGKKLYSSGSKISYLFDLEGSGEAAATTGLLGANGLPIRAGAAAGEADATTGLLGANGLPIRAAAAAGEADAITGGLAAASDLAPPLAAAIMGYKIASNVVQTGQQYGTLTGTDSIVGGYSAKLQSFASSLLNPLMPYGVSQQITNTGLASGYQYGSSYLSQYRDFASGAYEHFGISPQESQQMFQAAVVKAGGSANYLSTALQQVGQHAADAGVSFKELTNSFASSLQTYSGMGLSGNTATAAASVSAGLYMGGTQQQNQILSGVNKNTMQPFFGTMTGQAVLAQQLGTNLGGLYAKEQSMGAAAGTVIPMQQAAYVKHLLSGMGMSRGHTQHNLDPAFFALQGMGINFGSEQTLATFANEAFNTNDFTKGAIASIPKPVHQHAVIANEGGKGGIGFSVSTESQAKLDEQYKSDMAKYNKEVAAAKASGGSLSKQNMNALKNAFSGQQSGSSVNVGGVQINLSPSAQKLFQISNLGSGYGAVGANEPYGLPNAGNW